MSKSKTRKKDVDAPRNKKSKPYKRVDKTEWKKMKHKYAEED